MGQQLTKRNVRDRTLEYWEEKPGYRCYIDELLGEELKAAKNDNENPRRLQDVGQPVHTLALTVGESFEPLLQTICVLRPQRIILILNQRYGNKKGKEYGHNLSQLILYLVGNQNLPEDFRPQLLEKDIQIRELPADSPTQVFRTLLEEFQKSEAQPPAGYTNVVDITGAKKSMIAGAFFYAAHSGLPITYVDFDKYDPDWRRPYGYTCKIGQIANPYEAFHLRDWEQVRRLYTSYNFRGACELLEQIKQAMSSSLEGGVTNIHLFDDESIHKVQEFTRALRMYEAWDSGNFKRASQLSTLIPYDELPSAVTKLGPNWFEVTGSDRSDDPSNFYADRTALQVYAADEIARIERLMQHFQDYRSAFLRAAGLNEVLLTARLVEQIEDDNLRNRLLNAFRGKTPIGRRLFEVLTKNQGDYIDLNNLGVGRGWSERPLLRAPMGAWWQGIGEFGAANGWETFLDIRNMLAHRYVSVDPQLADDALSFVSANFADFFKIKVGQVPWIVSAVRWSRACAIFKLDFLPPQLRTDL